MKLILLIGLLSIFPWSVASSAETYEFERMWPALQQPWYFQSPQGVVVDNVGNIYIADTENNRIQKVAASGTITRVLAVVAQNNTINSFDLPDLGGGVYGATYSNFITAGYYDIAVYVMDAEGNISLPVTTRVLQTIGADVYEDDDTSATAGTITINDTAPQYHTFHDTGDQDWVMFYGLAGLTYEISLGNPGPNCDAVIELYGPDGTTLLLQKDDTIAGQSELMSWQSSAEGIYYVKIRNYDPDIFGDNTGYELKIYNPVGGIDSGYITGFVKDAVSGLGINLAVLKSTAGGSAVTRPDGSFIIWASSPSDTITVTKTGYVRVQTGFSDIPLTPNSVQHDILMSTAQNGDVNADGNVSIVDALLIARYAAGLSVNNFNPALADINCDGKVNIVDALLIARKAAGLAVASWCGN